VSGDRRTTATRPALVATIACLLGAGAGFLWRGNDDSARGPRHESGSQLGPQSANGEQPVLETHSGIQDPDLRLSTTLLTLGTVRMGTTATGSITVRNAGAVPVAFGVRTRCGCVEARVVPPVDRLRPQEEASIEIKVHTANRVGDFEERVMLVPESSPEAPMRLKLVGRIVGGIRILPEKLPATLLGQAITARVELEGAVDLQSWKPTAVYAVSSDRPDVRVSCPFLVSQRTRVPRGGLRYGVEALLPAARDVGRERVTLRVETNLDAATWPTTSIGYDVHPAVRPSPRSLHLGVVEPKHRPRSRLRLLPANDSVRFSIRAAEVLLADESGPHPSLGASYWLDDSGWQVEVVYRGHDGAAGRRIRGLLVVETDHAAVQHVRVPVSAVVPFRSRVDGMGAHK
jgi:hypothetical protein